MKPNIASKNSREDLTDEYISSQQVFKVAL